MCGIAGIWKTSRKSISGHELAGEIDRMLDPIVHRGPDSGGHWVDEKVQLALGHRRLAIVDLSPGGHQPMVSASGRYVISLNGEIYNFPSVRERLSGEGKLPPLRGTSDTEIALAAIEAWGLEGALKAFNGMYAFALWDRQEQTLSLARDRVGKKPLYYGVTGDGSLVFASELKSFFPLTHFERRISRQALGSYLELGYVPAPDSIFEGISKLDQGCFATFDHPGASPKIVRYWSLISAVAAGAASRERQANPVDDVDPRDSLQKLLEDAVRIRMLADVPLGALLSGGIDSSLVVALMQRVSSAPVRTFSIGFREDNYNEAKFAAEVARHLGTRHEELYVDPSDCLAAVPLMARIYDEPFSDSSQIPTYMVSKLARQHVTVCLSGDGGDEFFAGYNRYQLGGRLIRATRRFPSPLLRGAAAGLGMLSPEAWTAIYEHLRPVVQGMRGKRIAQVGDKIHKLQALLTGRDEIDIFAGLIRQWNLDMPGQSSLVSGTGRAGSRIRELLAPFWDQPGLSPVERMMLAD
ncbi:asparagine synthase (glutamine-hydrolyzing), partial [bacterium]|nr:asparagine synthase (glutamine-hydrolyzing) [bacterium]